MVTSLHTQFDDFRSHGGAVDLNLCDRHWQFEPTGASAAWIEEEHSVQLSDRRLVRVTADDDVVGITLGVMSKVVDVVDHVQSGPLHFDDGRVRQVTGPGAAIDVAANGYDRGDGLEAFEYFGLANVARVKQ